MRCRTRSICLGIHPRPPRSSLIASLELLRTLAIPRVSVIIATFNWSEALRCALRSVQRQTLEDFEVLVVGDCCTDDSETVVRSFGDPRFFWHNLPSNHGSQWAPNNFGIAHARGDWIAYLGHDDIWHPDHLSSLVSALDGRGAVGAVATMLMYGPPGSGTVQAAGAFATESLQPRDFVPPSGLIHSRALVDEIGPWKDARLIAMPTDCEFVARIIAHGLVVPSGVLTVFKFNAAARRDAYRRRSVVEQEAMLNSMEADPDVRHRELVGALRAFAAGKLSLIHMPAVLDEAPGAIARSNRRFKGVDEPFEADEMIVVDEPVRFGMERPVGGFEWHALETQSPYGSFRWSGPASVSVVDLPVACDQPLALTIRVLFPIEATILDQLALSINEVRVDYQVSRLDDGTFDLSTATETLRGHLRIAFEVPRTVRPKDLGPSVDDRSLGIAVAWIEVRPRDRAATASC